MGVYSKLADVLAARRGETWKAGFAELERLIGRKLPASAWKYPAWWSNNPSNNSMTKVWLNAGWRTGEVDVPGRSVVFRRLGAAPEAAGLRASGFGDRPRNFETASARAPEIKMATREMMMLAAGKETGSPGATTTPFGRLYGCMKGTIKVAPGVDLTEPVWGPEEWKAWEEKWDRLLPRKSAK